MADRERGCSRSGKGTSSPRTAENRAIRTGAQRAAQALRASATGRLDQAVAVACEGIGVAVDNGCVQR